MHSCLTAAKPLKLPSLLYYAINKTSDILLIEFFHCQKDYKKNLNLRIMIKPFTFNLCQIFYLECMSISV
jgi:hypothetical protein